jgi:PAT family acetyl-CoA transporter-like MFS transporter 1
MRATMSYTKIGIFSLAAYPYSFKLLWSPLVDTYYVKRIGRRKSWILPLQTTAAIIMILSGRWLEEQMALGHAGAITGLFFCLVLIAATQDIAVDGWALSLLTKQNVGFAATCQTVGMNIGYFTSFTVFLALSDPEFCSSYLGYAEGVSVMTLKGYLQFWGWTYISITIAVALFTQEKDFDSAIHSRNEKDPAVGDSTNSSTLFERLVEAYSQLWQVACLPSVRKLAIILLVARIGMLPAESAASLKLLEKGVSKEALAGLVLIQFPVELLSALLSGRWAASTHPLNPYIAGYQLRLALAAATTVLVYYFPSHAHSFSNAPVYFGILAVIGIATSFSSTLMFTALGDFYNRISDPVMGGAYLTLLNTLANIGVVIPKLGMFAAIDGLTWKRCRNGSCINITDGFYVLSSVTVLLGLVLTVWLRRTLRSLGNLPIVAWRSPHASKKPI